MVREQTAKRCPWWLWPWDSSSWVWSGTEFPPGGTASSAMSAPSSSIHLERTRVSGDLGVASPSPKRWDFPLNLLWTLLAAAQLCWFSLGLKRALCDPSPFHYLELVQGPSLAQDRVPVLLVIAPPVITGSRFQVGGDLSATVFAVVLAVAFTKCGRKILMERREVSSLDHSLDHR